MKIEQKQSKLTEFLDLIKAGKVLMFLNFIEECYSAGLKCSLVDLLILHY